MRSIQAPFHCPLVLGQPPSTQVTIPTGKAKDDSEAYTPEPCHEALMMDKPLYASLHITQKPSWICSPSSYAPHAISSLVFAFEDSDGNLKRDLLNSKHMYLFRAQAKIRKWKQTPPKPTDHHPQPQSSVANLNEASKTQVPITQTPLVTLDWVWRFCTTF